MIEASEVVSISEIEALWSLGHDKAAGRADPVSEVLPAKALTVTNDVLASTAPSRGVGGPQYAELVGQMIRVVDNGLVLKRLRELDSAMRSWKAKNRQGKISYQYSDLRNLYFDLRAMVNDADIVPTATDAKTGERRFNTSARLSTLQAFARVGMLVRFRSLFETQAETFRGQLVSLRPFGADEDLHSVAAGAGITWAELVDLNNLRWPYTSMTAAPGVLVPGESNIKTPTKILETRPTTSEPDRNGGNIGIDILRDKGTDLVSLGHGFLSRISGPANIVQSLTGQCNTVGGFYEEAPDWGAVWLRSGQGIGDFISDSLLDLFYFHLARMITFDGRLQSPDSISTRYSAGVTTMRFRARTADGEQISGLEVPL